MKRKIYLSVIHISSIIGLLSLTDWALKYTGLIDRTYSVGIGDRVTVKFSDINDYVEIHNYDGLPYLDKAIAIFVDDEIVGITQIQSTTQGEKGIEMIFSTYPEALLSS